VITVEHAIRALRRDRAVSMLVRTFLAGGLLLGFVGGAMIGSLAASMIMFMAVGLAWAALTYRSALSAAAAADSPSLIATGQFDEAENLIEQAIRKPSVFPNAKLVNLHHLAVLRHAQRKWADSARLSRALLSQRLKSNQLLARASQLMLADALVELNDLPGAFESLSRMYSQKLSLDEALALLSVQLDYEAKVGAWEAMVRNIASRVQMAELMPTKESARSQALLGLAALKTGRPDWAGWLKSRAVLLIDSGELTDERPILLELFPTNCTIPQAGVVGGTESALNAPPGEVRPGL